MKHFSVLFCTLMLCLGWSTEGRATQVFSSEVDTSTLYFTVWLHDGGINAYAFNERPVVTFEGDQLVVRTSEEEVEYADGVVHKFTIETTPPQPSSIGNPLVQPQIEIKRGDIALQGCKEGTQVRIYSLNGVLMSASNIGADGAAVVSTTQLPKGVYLIQTETLTYKFIKK